jgi:FkbM family methyltransferase
VDETAVVASLLRERRGPDHLMLDVGALRGSSAVHFARLGWTVHCFEPHGPSRDALATRFAGQRNVRIDARAVGEAPATGVPLYESTESSGITALRPFHASHHAAGTVEVTTISEVAREGRLRRVDFLKIDVEGLDLAVLKGVPWADLRPDVIECEFEDAKTVPLGHSWRDIAAYLRERGYAVYVSEWHPIIRYGQRHDWRRLVAFTDDLQIDPRAWGNLLAFGEDPRLPALRAAFRQLMERGDARSAPRPAPPGPGPRRRPWYRPIGRRLNRRAPALHGFLRRIALAFRRLARRPRRAG